jgi:hypothetical protein
MFGRVYQAADGVSVSNVPLDDALIAAANGWTIVLEEAAAALLHSRYTLALAGTYAHLKADLGVAALTALPPAVAVEEEEIAVEQAAANARAEELRTILAAHMLGVGNSTTDGFHKAADSARRTTLLAIAAATDLASCITLVNGLKTAFAHGSQAGVHFTNDAALAAATITTDPPTTLAHCTTDLNDVLAALTAHFALATP